MDPTDSIPGTGAERREPSPPPQAEAAAASVAGETIATGGDAEPAADLAPGEPTDGRASEGAPRPRRRRRRRRRPSPAASLGEVGAEREPRPAESVADAAAVGEGGGDAAPTTEGGMAQRPILRLRNRRRRRRPAAPGLLPGTADSTAPSEQASAATDEAGADGTPGTPPAQRSFRVPRRRRRHAPLSAPAAGEATPGEGAPGASDRREPGTETARPRNRNRRRTAGPPRTGTEGTAQPSERDNRGPSQRGHRGDRPAADGQRSEGRRDGGPRAGQRDGRRDRRDGPPGRGRRDAPRPIERKLYSMDSVVDRGFDDVEEEAGTRRVHWTIVKRTTADQLSRKAVSAAYVLQRDGVDSEFPSLGAARAAVNKTIVHPEKLTRSKAEYAAERSAKK